MTLKKCHSTITHFVYRVELIKFCVSAPKNKKRGRVRKNFLKIACNNRFVMLYFIYFNLNFSLFGGINEFVEYPCI